MTLLVLQTFGPQTFGPYHNLLPGSFFFDLSGFFIVCVDHGTQDHTITDKYTEGTIVTLRWVPCQPPRAQRLRTVKLRIQDQDFAAEAQDRRRQFTDGSLGKGPSI